MLIFKRFRIVETKCLPYCIFRYVCTYRKTRGSSYTQCTLGAGVYCDSLVPYKIASIVLMSL